MSRSVLLAHKVCHILNVSAGERATETGETRWKTTEQGAQTEAQTARAGDGQRAEQTQWRHVSVRPQGELQQLILFTQNQI